MFLAFHCEHVSCLSETPIYRVRKKKKIFLECVVLTAISSVQGSVSCVKSIGNWSEFSLYVFSGGGVPMRLQSQSCPSSSSRAADFDPYNFICGK